MNTCTITSTRNEKERGRHDDVEARAATARAAEVEARAEDANGRDEEPSGTASCWSSVTTLR